MTKKGDVITYHDVPTREGLLAVIASEGTREKTAAWYGTSGATVYRWMKQLGIDHKFKPGRPKK